jgi:uncharacterized protein
MDRRARFFLYSLCFYIVQTSAVLAQDAQGYVPEMPPLPKAQNGALSWDFFSETKENQKKITHDNGSYTFEITPVFAQRMKDLNGKQVKLHGFMFPLEQSEEQSDFLFGPFPSSCPFHYHIPPQLVVEIAAKTPIAFTWDPITLKGTLELVEKDTNDIYYILNDAELAQ